MKKNIVLFGVPLVVLLIVLVLSFVSSKKTGVNKGVLMPSPAPTSLPQIAALPPPIIVVPSAPAGVQFSFSGTRPALPSSLPRYGVMWTAPEKADAAVLSVAQRLGFTKAPKALRKNTSLTEWWNDSFGSFSYARTENVGSISYVLTKQPPVPGGQSSEDAAVRQFLGDTVGLPSSPLSLKTLSVSEGGGEGFVFEDQPTPKLRRLSYVFLIQNSYPLLLANFGAISANSVVDEYMRVRSLSYIFPPEKLTAGQELRLLSLDEMVNSLNVGRGTLLSNMSETEWGFQTDFRSVSLSKATMVYVLDPKQTTAVPACIFDGIAASAGGKTISVTYLVYAFPD